MGDWQGFKYKCKSSAAVTVFVEDKKLVSNLHISRVYITQYFCLDLGINLDFSSAFEIRLLVHQDK